MSDQNKNNDDKGFLSRWSQRKQEAKLPEHEAPVAEVEASAAPVAESEAEPEFDLSSLPKLADLTETTDITAFLRKGVPEDLRNAALRKSWALDPAIRNYVNPALDYAYDWNTPGGVPGNSEIGAGMDVARLVSQIMGTGESVAESAASAATPGAEPASDPVESPIADAAQKSEPALPVEPVRLGNETVPMTQRPIKGDEAEGLETRDASAPGAVGAAAPQQSVRRHGSAKPVV